MTEIIPTPKQQDFLSSNADVCLMAGGAGSGKSFTLLIDSLGLNDTKFGPRYQLPFYRGLIYRRQFKHLNDLIDKSKNIFPLFDKGAIFTSTNMTWRFSSGSEIQFMYFEDMSQVEAIQGRELNFIGCDELGQYKDDKIFRYCLSRLRSSQGLKCYYRATSNPSRSAWLKNTFKIGPDGLSTKFTEEYQLSDNTISKKTFQYIQAMLSDNPHLSKDYEAQLMLLPEDERNALLYGRWDAFDFSDATIYKKEYQQMEAENRITTVRLQQGQDIYVAFDLGWADYTSVIVFQICGKEYQILESFENNNQQIDWYVAELKRRGYNENIKIIVPHDAAQKSLQTGLSMQEKLENFYPSDNIKILPRAGIEDGIKHVREKFPFFFIDKNKNEKLLECIKNYERTYNSKTDQYGEPLHDKFSHMADALRYMCAYTKEAPPPVFNIPSYGRY